MAVSLDPQALPGSRGEGSADSGICSHTRGDWPSYGQFAEPEALTWVCSEQG